MAMEEFLTNFLLSFFSGGPFGFEALSETRFFDTMPVLKCCAVSDNRFPIGGVINLLVNCSGVISSARSNNILLLVRQLPLITPRAAQDPSARILRGKGVQTKQIAGPQAWGAASREKQDRRRVSTPSWLLRWRVAAEGAAPSNTVRPRRDPA